ncbi:Hypothetical protein domain [Nesidiocoris tenuis]|uniref:SAM domain-containing protein n=1 Tax=Nesidiocoris tenuis TaxID=355587 RepID=A0ABN7AH26_9HEMI|nr:Hypothetical protein domain [Nesidiocoris tenuis]
MSSLAIILVISTREDAQSETTSCSTIDDRHLLTGPEREDVARLLGISEEEVIQERFRVSRRRMEQLLFGSSPGSAAQFFDSIMQDTNTVLIWPTRMKENAKSKKDPFIKARGQAINVEKAKNRVIEGLDPEVKSVTLKVDISYTDHSHIIGRGGNTIKSVMSATGCHIHFPDCNRSNENEKSNMVSITGQLDRVEVARAKIRSLIPLVFSFDFPVLGAIFMPLEEHNPFIASLKEEYNVQVLLRTRQKLNSTLVLVKGSSTEYERVKEATEKLIAHIRSPQGEPVQIHTSIEISPHHHFIVRGKDNVHLNLIKRKTGTQITFPDLGDSNIPTIKRSNVIITGDSIRNVYLALQLIIGSLPVVFSFEMPEGFVSMSNLREASEQFDVSITAKLKTKANLYTIFIKSVERNMENIYNAYKAVVDNRDGLPVRVEIPSTYLLSDALPYNVITAGCNEGRSPGYRSPLPSSPSLHPTSTHHTGGRRSPTSPILLQPTQGYGNSTSPLLKDLGAFGQPPLINQAAYSSFWPHQNFLLHGLAIPDRSTGRLSSSIPSLSNDRVDSSASGFKSNLSSPVPSLTRTSSPSPSQQGSNTSGELSYCRASTSQADSSSYDQLRISALQAKRQKVKPSELRIPTNFWSGFGFSQSSPPPPNREFRRSFDGQSRSDLSEDGDESRSMYLGASARSNESIAQPNSNFLEMVSDSIVESVNQAPFTQDMYSLLASIGMERYYSNFVENEVQDLEVLLTFNEADLISIGVNALGARKKFLMLIAGLKRRRQFRKTPGAERKKPNWWPEY